MTAAAGYSIEQLLSWCMEDNLIDGYEKDEVQVVIFQGEARHRLTLEQAESFLKSMFKSSSTRRRSKWQERVAQGRRENNVA